MLIICLKTGAFSSWDIPVDHGILFKGKSLFGRNKTYRGVIIYIVGSLATTVLLWSLRLNGEMWVHWVFAYNPIVLGCLFGLSYSLGELINSFIKRRLGIKPGGVNSHFTEIQYFFDLVDGPVVVTIVLIVIYGFSWQSLAALFFGVLIHWFAEFAMYKLNLKKKH